MKAINAAQAKLKEMRERGIKRQCLSPVEKARKNPKSLRLAINGNCWMCAGNGNDGAKACRETIAFCTDEGCSCYGVRPYQPKTELIPVVGQDSVQNELKTKIQLN